MAHNKYNVTLARRVERMLMAHTEFLSRVSVAAARRLLVDFKKKTRLLAANPQQFPFADELDAPGIPPQTYRKCIFDERYKALYLIEGTDVFIDAVIDCRQENKNLF